MGTSLSSADSHKWFARHESAWWSIIWNGATLYIGTGLIVFLGMVFGQHLLDPFGRWESFQKIDGSNDAILKGASQWDGQIYLQIATEGYFYHRNDANVVFFPLFPMTVAAVYRISGLSIETAGLVVAHVCLLSVFVLFGVYARERFESTDSPIREDGGQVRSDHSQAAIFALLALGFMPTAFFMRMVYTESMFLLLAVLVFLGIQRRWKPVVIAAIVGLATATRPVGVALVPPLLWHVWCEAPTRRQAMWRMIWLAPVAVWGLAAYMVYQYIVFGNTLAFAQAQELFHTRPPAGLGERCLSLASWEPIWSAYMPGSLGYAGQKNLPAIFDIQMANPVYFVAAAILVGLGFAKRWLTTAETLAGAGLLFIPYVTRAFEMKMASQGRFASVVFPMYLVLGHILARLGLPASVCILGLGAAFLAIYSALFAAGFCLI